MKNFRVEIVYFVRNNSAWVQCKVAFHLPAYNVREALEKAVDRLEGVTLNDIEDARIEKEV